MINGLKVTIPSEDMVQGSTYAFVLQVDTELGGSAAAEVQVHKSSRVYLTSKVRICQRAHGGLSFPLDRTCSVTSMLVDIPLENCVG